MSEFTAFEHDGWQRAALAYEQGFLPLTQQAIDPLLDAAGVRAGVRVLDLASGPGNLAGAAAARGALVTGTDFSEAMLDIARRRHPKVTFQQADAQALPFDDTSFDAVTMAFLLGHLADPDLALREASRVLVHGGRLAFAWWQGLDRALAFGDVMAALNAHGNLDVGLPPGPPFDRFNVAEECRRSLKAAGFAHIVVVEAPLVWRPPSAESVFETYMTGGVRMTAVLRAQTPEALVRIRAAMLTALARHETKDELAIPMPVWIASGRRP